MSKLAGMVDTRSGTERGMGAASDFGLEFAAGKLAPLIPAAVRKGFTSAKNRMTGQGAPEIYDKFRAIGAKPSAGTISGDKGMQTLEQGISSSVGGAETIKQSDNALMEHDGTGRRGKRGRLIVNLTENRATAGWLHGYPD
jgi:hypothetical protein